MKRTLLCIGMLVALSACSTQLTPAQLKAALNDVPTLIAAGCTVVQPTLAAGAVATANPTAGVAAGVNGVFCAANEAAAASGAVAASSPVAASTPAASK